MPIRHCCWLSVSSQNVRRINTFLQLKSQNGNGLVNKVSSIWTSDSWHSSIFSNVGVCLFPSISSSFVWVLFLRVIWQIIYKCRFNHIGTIISMVNPFRSTLLRLFCVILFEMQVENVSIIQILQNVSRCILLYIIFHFCTVSFHVSVLHTISYIFFYCVDPISLSNQLYTQELT